MNPHSRPKVQLLIEGQMISETSGLARLQFELNADQESIASIVFTGEFAPKSDLLFKSGVQSATIESSLDQSLI